MLVRACFSNFKRDRWRNCISDTYREPAGNSPSTFTLFWRTPQLQKAPETARAPERTTWQPLRAAGPAEHQPGRQRQPRCEAAAPAPRPRRETPASPRATTNARHHNHGSSGENAAQHKPGKTNFAGPESPAQIVKCPRAPRPAEVSAGSSG